MADNPTAVVGPFFLERTYRVPVLRIYKVYSNPPKEPLARLWQTSKPDFGVAPEWRIDCLACPPPPSLAREEKGVSVFATRERALKWLLRHRQGAHRPLSGAA